MDLTRLRSLLHPRIIALKDVGPRHTFPALCESLGLPRPGPDGSKRDGMNACFEALPDAELPRFAERLLKLHPPEASVRNEIEDVLWADTPIEIPKKFRRDVARSLTDEELYLDAKQFDELLDKFWVLDNDLSLFFGTSDRSLRRAIRKHVHDNPGDWSVETLFDELGAFDASDRRFALFLEGLASSDVRPDEAAQRRFVQIVNAALSACRVELRESDTNLFVALGCGCTFTLCRGDGCDKICRAVAGDLCRAMALFTNNTCAAGQRCEPDKDDQF